MSFSSRYIRRKNLVSVLNMHGKDSDLIALQGPSEPLLQRLSIHPPPLGGIYCWSWYLLSRVELVCAISRDTANSVMHRQSVSHEVHPVVLVKCKTSNHTNYLQLHRFSFMHILGKVTTAIKREVESMKETTRKENVPIMYQIQRAVRWERPKHSA